MLPSRLNPDCFDAQCDKVHSRTYLPCRFFGSACGMAACGAEKPIFWQERLKRKLTEEGEEGCKQVFEPSCLVPRDDGNGMRMVVVRPGYPWAKQEPQMVKWEGEPGSARVMPCGYYADGKSGRFYELQGHVLVVWHDTGPRPVAVLPKAAVPKAAVARKARRSGWPSRVPPVPVAAPAAPAAVAPAAPVWPARGPLPPWAIAARLRVGQ